MKGSCILAAAIVIAGAMLPVSVAKLKSYDRTVTVKGLCEREVKADKATWDLAYKVMGNDLQPLLKEIEKNNSTIRTFLASGGIAAEDIYVSSPSISDKLANEYGNNDRTYRYIISNTITVCSENVDAVLALEKNSAELLKKGITMTYNEWSTPVSYQYEALNDIKPAMIEEATSNARTAAQKFAQDSGSSIGRIKTASQGTFSIESRDTNTPYIKKVRVVTNVTYYLKR
ncbi:MAG: SIMPL domain-containing protein [Bacteroidales bacterium]|nr:SIMPL domain-containing protein [Candidatus Cryptobacteroides aphodequi]